MERIQIDGRSAILGGLLGAVLGAATGGYLAGVLVNRRVQRTFDARLDAEVSAVKAHYNDRLKNYAGAVPVFAGIPGDHSDDESGTAMGIDGDRDGKEDGDGAEIPDQPASEDLASAVVRPWPPLNRDRTRPYCISLEEFGEQIEPGWQQLTIMYYAGDRVLADDKEQPIRDVRGTTGPITKGGFGGVSQDDNIRYVRNERLEVDFEICYDPRSYADAVLNYGNPNRR